MLSYMKKSIILLSSVVLTMMLFAGQSLFGPSGLLITPDAAVIEERNFSVGFTQWNDSLDPTYSLNYGIFKNAEVNVVSLPNKEMSLNGKYHFMSSDEDASLGLDAAVGVNDAFGSTRTIMYVVADLDINIIDDALNVSDTKLTMGFGTGKKDSILATNGLFGGVQTTVFDRVNLVLEYDGNKLNYGAKTKFGNFSANIAWTGQGHQMRLGANYETKVNFQ